MALSYNLGYQEITSVHPTRRQIFAGKPDSTFLNIWEWLVHSCTSPKLVGRTISDLLGEYNLFMIL